MSIKILVQHIQVFALACCCLASCKSTSPTKAPSKSEVSSAPRAENPDDHIYRPAIVESVRCQVITSKPPQALVTINGLLQDGATNLHEVKTTRITGGFMITINTSRARDAIASLALVPYERIVPLDLTGMTSGPIQINVNGVTSEFTIP